MVKRLSQKWNMKSMMLVKSLMLKISWSNHARALFTIQPEKTIRISPKTYLVSISFKKITLHNEPKQGIK